MTEGIFTTGWKHKYIHAVTRGFETILLHMGKGQRLLVDVWLRFLVTDYVLFSRWTELVNVCFSRSEPVFGLGVNIIHLKEMFVIDIVTFRRTETTHNGPQWRAEFDADFVKSNSYCNLFYQRDVVLAIYYRNYTRS